MVILKQFLRVTAFLWLLWGTFSAILVACIIVSILGIKLFLASLNLPPDTDSGDPLGYSAVFFVPCGIASIGIALLISVITAIFISKRLFRKSEVELPTF